MFAVTVTVTGNRCFVIHLSICDSGDKVGIEVEASEGERCVSVRKSAGSNNEAQSLLRHWV